MKCEKEREKAARGTKANEKIHKIEVDLIGVANAIDVGYISIYYLRKISRNDQ